MGLVQQFLANERRLLRRKHQNSSRWEAQRRNMIIQFLEFCEGRNIKRVNNIQKKHYDAFVRRLKKQGKSDATIRNYGYILREFFDRAKLRIQVSPYHAYSKKRQKKLERVREILERHEVSRDQTEQILSEISQII